MKFRQSRDVIALALVVLLSGAIAAWASGSGGGSSRGSSGGSSGGSTGGSSSSGSSGPPSTNQPTQNAVPPDIRDQANLTDPQFTAGMKLVAARDYEQALPIFVAIVDRNPRNADAWKFIGFSDRMLGLTTEAGLAFDEALYIAPAQVDTHQYLGELYVEIGDLAKAREQLAAIESKCGANCPEYQGLAFALASISLGDGTQSGRPVDVDYVAAVRSIQHKDFARGLGLLAQVIARDPDNADAWNYTGFANRMIGQFPEAFSAYRQALAIEPNHLGAHEYLGELYIQTGALDKAKAQLARLEKLCTADCRQYRELASAIATGKSAW